MWTIGTECSVIGFRGEAFQAFPGDRVAIAQFIESDPGYRLVWGMEAARVFEEAQGNALAETLNGTAVTSIETGTFNWSASVLSSRSGFDHRLAAMEAVVSTDAEFESAADMRQWIRISIPGTRTTQHGQPLNLGQRGRHSRHTSAVGAFSNGAGGRMTFAKSPGTETNQPQEPGCASLISMRTPSRSGLPASIFLERPQLRLTPTD